MPDNIGILLRPNKIQENIKILEGLKIGVEISFFDKDIVYEYGMKKMKEITDRIRGYGGLITVHGPIYDINPISKDRNIRDYSREFIYYSLEIAEEIGAKHFILHTPFAPIFPKNFLPQWFESFTSFLQNLLERTSHISILLENFVHDTIESFQTIFSMLSSNRLGMCLDIGHLYVYQKQSPLLWLENFSNRIKELHIHDNDKETDEHLALGKGVIDFSILKYFPVKNFSWIFELTIEEFLESRNYLNTIGIEV